MQPAQRKTFAVVPPQEGAVLNTTRAMHEEIIRVRYRRRPHPTLSLDRTLFDYERQELSKVVELPEDDTNSNITTTTNNTANTTNNVFNQQLPRISLNVHSSSRPNQLTAGSADTTGQIFKLVKGYEEDQKFPIVTFKSVGLKQHPMRPAPINLHLPGPYHPPGVLPYDTWRGLKYFSDVCYCDRCAYLHCVDLLERHVILPIGLILPSTPPPLTPRCTSRENRRILPGIEEYPANELMIEEDDDMNTAEAHCPAVQRYYSQRSFDLILQPNQPFPNYHMTFSMHHHNYINTLYRHPMAHDLAILGVEHATTVANHLQQRAFLPEFSGSTGMGQNYTPRNIQIAERKARNVTFSLAHDPPKVFWYKYEMYRKYRFFAASGREQEAQAKTFAHIFAATEHLQKLEQDRQRFKMKLWEQQRDLFNSAGLTMSEMARVHQAPTQLLPRFEVVMQRYIMHSPSIPDVPRQGYNCHPKFTHDAERAARYEFVTHVAEHERLYKQQQEQEAKRLHKQQQRKMKQHQQLLEQKRQYQMSQQNYYRA